MYLSASAESVDDGPGRNGSDRTARNGVWPSLSQGADHADTQRHVLLGDADVTSGRDDRVVAGEGTCAWKSRTGQSTS